MKAAIRVPFVIGLITNPSPSPIDFIKETLQQAGINSESESRSAESAHGKGKESAKRRRRFSRTLGYNAFPLIHDEKTMDILSDRWYPSAETSSMDEERV
jgi:hypothetical protein